MIKLDGKAFLIWVVIVLAFLLFTRGEIYILRPAWFKSVPARALLALVAVVFFGGTFVIAIALRFALRLFGR